MTSREPEAAEMVKRLRRQAGEVAKASQMLADDKTIRNRIAGDADANYQGVPKERTLEWQSADLIESLTRELALARGNEVGAAAAIEAGGQIADLYLARATAAEQALTAAHKALEEIGEIAGKDKRFDPNHPLSAGLQWAAALDRIATIAKGSTSD